jgi:hypothetical protein
MNENKSFKNKISDFAYRYRGLFWIIRMAIVIFLIWYVYFRVW